LDGGKKWGRAKNALHFIRGENDKGKEVRGPRERKVYQKVKGKYILSKVISYKRAPRR